VVIVLENSFDGAKKTKGKMMEASKHVTDLVENGVSMLRNKA